MWGTSKTNGDKQEEEGGKGGGGQNCEFWANGLFQSPWSQEIFEFVVIQKIIDAKLIV